jgi:hypothetical protein
MDQTTNLKLPYIIAAQSQKHVTHNEALKALDAVVQLAVLDRDLAAPPTSPADSARYIVGASATGAWSGQSGKIAAFQDGAWQFYAPLEGWIAWVADEDILVAWNGSAWIAAGGGISSVNPVALVGVNATADTTNRLSVASPATLLNHEGAGHQVKINKSAAAQTASVLYQTGFSGRAEFGTTGDDDFHVKVSPDGSTWREAIVIDRTTGSVWAKLGLPWPPGGRLTLTSATPVLSSDVSGATTVYYTPYLDQWAPLYDGTAFVMTNLGGELSQATTDTAKSPAACTTNSNYDLFLWNDNGTLRCTRGPAWSSSTSRGTGAGTTELERVQGIWVNKVAITNGPAAQRGTYVGTIRTNASSQVDFKLGGAGAGGTKGVLGIWNAYNRRRVLAYAAETTDSWTYTTNTWRQANNSSGNQIDLVRGLNEDLVQASVLSLLSHSAGGFWAAVGVGISSSTVNSAQVSGTGSFSGSASSCTAQYAGNPGIGLYEIRRLEIVQAAATGTMTWYGDGGQTFFNTGIMVIAWA